ncbi:hypothetical protein QZH41_010230, partial [Actinostola sp. cb2023]
EDYARIIGYTNIIDMIKNSPAVATWDAVHSKSTHRTERKGKVYRPRTTPWTPYNFQLQLPKFPKLLLKFLNLLSKFRLRLLSKFRLRLLSKFRLRLLSKFRLRLLSKGRLKPPLKPPTCKLKPLLSSLTLPPNPMTVEERLRLLEEKYKADSVTSALERLHRKLDRTRFDSVDAICELEALVKVAKRSDHAKAKEYECILDEVQKNTKSLTPEGTRDLLIALVGDPVKSSVLKKASKALKLVNRKDFIPQAGPSWQGSYRQPTSAYGTVDSLIGKLRAIFNEADRRGEWDPRLLIGNPATDLSLKKYLREDIDDDEQEDPEILN